MAVSELPIDAIKVGERARKDLGDIQALVDSILSIGLLQPIVVAKDHSLIAGQRRLVACERLHWETIPVFIADCSNSALALVEAERDENTCRKDFTPEEAVLIAKRITAAIAKDAKQKQNEAAKRGGKTAGKGRPKNSLPENCGKANDRHSRETTSRVAATVGMSGRQLEKAKAVVDSGNQQAIDQMNKTGKVDPAFRAVKREEKKKQLREKAVKAAEVMKAAWTIIHGDCLEELPNLSGARLVFADPPYNLGIDYGTGSKGDSLPVHEYLNWCNDWIVACASCLTNDGSMWVMICDEWAEEFAEMLNQVGLHRRAWIKWYETFGVNCTNNFNRCSRHIFYYVVHPDHFVFNAESRYIRRPSDRQAIYGDKRADPAGKLLDDVWQVPRLVDNSAERIPDFPTQIPLEIVRRIVACASEPGDLVIDPFSGSGSTGHAALELHRRFTGIEKEERFWELSTVRLAGVTPFAPDAQ